MVWYDYNFFAMNIIVYWQQTSMFLKTNLLNLNRHLISSLSYQMIP